MLGFASPELLLLAPLAPLVAWHAVRRRRPALRFSDLSLTDDLPRGRAVRAVWGTAILRGLAVLALVVAAANPRTPDLRTRLPADGIAAVLALDVSGSMAAPDYGTPPTSRLDAAKRAFRLFVAGGEAADGTRFPGRPQDQLGLVAFAAVPRTVCPLTLNHSVLLAVLDDQKPREGLDAGTNIGDAMAEGLIRLEAAGPARKKVLILLSDGEHNAAGDGADRPLTPRQSAQLAANLGVPVYAIDCGGDPPATASPEEAEQRAAGRRTLEAVASRSGGRFFAAGSAWEMQAACRDIDALTRSPVERFYYRRYHEYGAWFAAAGVGLLVVGRALELTRWRRLP